MDTSSDPLRFPEHYPPATRWKRFFIGVRWLGPDLSFLKALKSQQAQRSNELMTVWGGGLRQEVAALIGRRARKSFRWKGEVFLPTDSFETILHGPTFGWGDDYPLESVVFDLRKAYGIEVPNDFWYAHEKATFGEAVDGLVAIINDSK